MAFTRTKASSAARGYGTAHTAARRAWAARHQPTDLCVRCRRPLGPMGPHLHLDHNRTRTGYLGFAHAQCNRKAGSREGRARQGASRLRW